MPCAMMLQTQTEPLRALTGYWSVQARPVITPEQTQSQTLKLSSGGTIQWSSQRKRYCVSVIDQATVATIKIAKLTLSRRLQVGWMNNLRIRLPAKSHRTSNTTHTSRQIKAFA